MQYPDYASKSAALYERAKQYLPGGNTRTTIYLKPYQIYAARGRGCRIWDVDGNERIDCINNFTAGIHGYAHPELVRAAKRQLELGSAFGMQTESEIDLAQLLSERVSSVDQSRFANSGTEAVMTAIKAARAYTGRSKIAKCEGAYHGTYDYAEVSLDSPVREGKQGWPESVPYAVGTPRGVTDDVVTLPFNDIDTSVAILRAHATDLAAILIDPMPNRVGLVPADRDYLQALRHVASEIGALLIFDEVITFRLGFNGAQKIWGVDADITTFGKIIGGGFPVGAVGGSRDVMAVFDPTSGKPPVPHGGTFSANPMTMVAGLKTMQLLDPAAFEKLDRLGSRIRSGFDEAFLRARIDGRTTGMGSLLKIHFTTRAIRDYQTATPSPAATLRMNRLMTGLLNEGVLIAPNGLLALSTPMSDADIDEVIRAFERALSRVDH
jgi:glutamate-1-semialdehyde 2,1-aminomutase